MIRYDGIGDFQLSYYDINSSKTNERNEIREREEREMSQSGLQRQRMHSHRNL